VSLRADLAEAFEGFWNPAGVARAVRHPIAHLRDVVGDGPLYALVVLSGLNLVDELDRTGFGILLPNIRDAFGLSDTGILSLVALTALGALLLQLPIAILADRGNRTALALAGGVAWGVFSFLTGMAASVWMLILVRSGSGIGRAVVDPTHNSLLSDYFPVERRPAVFSFHRSANSIGQFIGPLAAGGLAAAFGWRVPFLVFAIPTAIFVLLALRLREPVRGGQERKAMGATAEVVETEEPTPSFGEAWRLVWKVEVLRRIWYAIPFLAVAIVGYVSLAGLLYEQVFDLREFQRGIVAAFVEPFQLVGLVVGARVGVKLVMRDPASVFGFLRYVAFAAGAATALFAVAPNIYLAVAANVAVTMVLAALLPGLFTVLSMAIPARARAVGFSVASYWAIPGLAIVPLIGWVSDNFGIRWGMLLMTPVLVIGALMVSTGGAVIRRDIDDVWTASAARSQALFLRRKGEAKLLLVKDLNVSYGPVQILFDVSMEVAEGEVVALLGTNGAGKSTLLKAISGVVEADFGAVIFDGRDITHAPPHEIAALGVGQMPGGAAVFPSLTVRENLRAASWLHRREDTTDAVDLALAAFPILAERMDEPAANLSGGQQQMLGLAMSLLSRPRLLMVDELSLGLAPVVVEQLAALVRRVAAEGTTVILVEQSVNIALTLAETAYFMEKGQIRYRGSTAELLERPDLLRSVFLGTPAPSAGPEPRQVVDRPPILTIRDATVSFGGIRAVDEVDLDLAEGEILGLIGPNGAGKTTLLDLISGFIPLDRGSISLRGTDLTRLPPNRRAAAGLGRSFQDARLFPSLSVAEALAVSYDRWTSVKDPINPILRLPAAVDCEDRVTHRVDELVELFGLGPYRDKFLGELSTGTRRMVDLAGVVAHSPEVLLLDEPSSGIAQRETEALGPLICRLRDELGCSIIVVEHDMPLICSISDRLVALESGRVIATGTPDEVMSDPAVIESYLGSTPALVARSGGMTT
jgi:ABC-type branched-subunit amino acid transport system ATPase component/sugar phosphate permease